MLLLKGDRETGSDLLDGRREGEEESRGRRLLCAACGETVAEEGDRATVEGRHAHRRTNPVGLTFDFGCFGAAPGALPIGTATTEHTWFPGHAWRFALCRACGEQLGWHFEGADSAFFGLIDDRLVPEPEGRPS
jgi:hypothetical protein